MFNKHPRDMIGRYTKAESISKKIRRIYWYYMSGVLITVFAIMAYGGLLFLTGQVYRAEAQNTPQGQIEALNDLPQGVIREVTMYRAGVPAETDQSPCISANGENICAAIAKGYKRCAANFVPLGTDLIIQNYGECKVTDRMASRFSNRVDIAVGADELTRAINFGVQHLEVIVK